MFINNINKINFTLTNSRAETLNLYKHLKHKKRNDTISIIWE